PSERKGFPSADWVYSIGGAAMIAAGRAANGKGIPVILDPVGAGATGYRTAAVQRLLRDVRVAVIRGNASEIAALVVAATATRGVDSGMAVGDAEQHALALARQQHCIVAVSGPEDFITDGTMAHRIGNGHPLMTRVTGLGCGLSAVTGAFCAVAGDDRLTATAAAFGYYGLCGERAFVRAQLPGSFAVAFVDALADITPDDVRTGLQLR
ncbi:MAG TPA: hydroxyethylthiazole kinase, partial [bacterium]|nr:hydroxyethylthiazole kinase [bacterium]